MQLTDFNFYIMPRFFEQLDLLERNPLRLVCRRFRYAVDLITYTELVVVRFVPENYVTSHLWYGTGEFADQRNFINRLDLQRCEELAQLGPAIWKRVRRLRIEHSVSVSDLAKMAKVFRWLEHLDLQTLAFDRYDVASVSLPALNVLVIDGVKFEDPVPQALPQLRIESEGLRTVCFGELF